MIKKLIGTLALTMLVAANANASSLDITGPAAVNYGDPLVLEIYGDFSAQGLFAGGITLLWDAALVQLDSITFNVPIDVGFSCPGSPGCPPATDGSAPIVWGNFANPILAIGSAANTLMATLSFSALDLPVPGTEGSDPVAIFSMVNNTQLTGGWFGVNDMVPPGFLPIDAPSFGTHMVDITSTVVPLPAAVWFMVGGLGTLLGFRRK